MTNPNFFTQTGGQAMPVLLVQGNGTPDKGSREYEKWLKKELKAARGDQAKKKEAEKKGKTFTYLELVSWLIIASLPTAAAELAIVKAVGVALRTLN